MNASIRSSFETYSDEGDELNENIVHWMEKLLNKPHNIACNKI